MCFVDVHEHSGRLFSILQHIYCSIVDQLRAIRPVLTVDCRPVSLGAAGATAKRRPLSVESLERGRIHTVPIQRPDSYIPTCDSDMEYCSWQPILAGKDCHDPDLLHHRKLPRCSRDHR